MLILLSPAWIKSKWCFAEYTHARTLGKDIIPIIIKHGKNNEVNEAISTYIQNMDATLNKNAIPKAIQRIKKVSLEIQGGFKWDENRSPYPGMVSFEKNDAAIFFGREKETKDIIEKLNGMKTKNKPKLLSIIATSGMGKSSLLKAGILSTLKQTYSDTWILLPHFTPSKRPLYEFAKILAKFTGKSSEEFKAIYETLKTNAYIESLDNILTDIEFSVDNFSKLSILLPVDQAEEFYTSASSEEKENFYRCLNYLMKVENFFTIFTLRSDFLNEYQEDESSKYIRKYEEIFTLLSMAKENISAIIKKPAKIAGISVDEDLVEKIKEDIQTSDALPLLALCLNKLYQKHGKKDRHLTLNDYLNLGEKGENPLELIIKTIANEAIQDFTNEEILQLKNAFIPHLIRVNDQGNYIKTTSSIDKLPSNTHKIIEALVKARLILKDGNDISIAHEALLRKWSLLNNWLHEKHEFLLWKIQFDMEMNEWIKKNQGLGDEDPLLHGTRLEQALHWKEKFPQIFSMQEKLFINQSMFTRENENKHLQDLYIKAQLELIQSKHNVGLVYLEKAQKSMQNKNYIKANFYAYNALESFKTGITDERSIAKGIIVRNSLMRLFFSKKIYDKNITSIAITLDKRKMAIGFWDGIIKILDLIEQKELHKLISDDINIISMAFSPDGSELISCSYAASPKLDTKKQI